MLNATWLKRLSITVIIMGILLIFCGFSADVLFFGFHSSSPEVKNPAATEYAQVVSHSLFMAGGAFLVMGLLLALWRNRFKHRHRHGPDHH